MPLISSSLAKALEATFERKPSSAAEAAADWAKAYLTYAASALSPMGGLPVTAAANLGPLLGAFTAAFQAQSSSGAAALVARGVTDFWGAMVWAGPASAGTTASPGNASLAAALDILFADTSDKTAGDGARSFADAFDAGAKLVMVSDIPLVQPAPTVVGPIS